MAQMQLQDMGMVRLLKICSWPRPSALSKTEHAAMQSSVAASKQKIWLLRKAFLPLAFLQLPSPC